MLGDGLVHHGELLHLIDSGAETALYTIGDVDGLLWLCKTR